MRKQFSVNRGRRWEKPDFHFSRGNLTMFARNWVSRATKMTKLCFQNKVGIGRRSECCLAACSPMTCVVSSVDVIVPVSDPPSFSTATIGVVISAATSHLSCSSTNHCKQPLQVCVICHGGLETSYRVLVWLKLLVYNKMWTNFSAVSWRTAFDRCLLPL